MKIKKKTYFQVFWPIFFFIYHFWMGFCWERKKSPKIYCNITSILIIKAKKLFLIPCEISENVLLPMHCAPPSLWNFSKNSFVLEAPPSLKEPYPTLEVGWRFKVNMRPIFPSFWPTIYEEDKFYSSLMICDLIVFSNWHYL